MGHIRQVLQLKCVHAPPAQDLLPGLTPLVLVVDQLINVLILLVYLDNQIIEKLVVEINRELIILYDTVFWTYVNEKVNVILVDRLAVDS